MGASPAIGLPSRTEPLFLNPTPSFERPPTPKTQFETEAISLIAALAPDDIIAPMVDVLLRALRAGLPRVAR